MCDIYLTSVQSNLAKDCISTPQKCHFPWAIWAVTSRCSTKMAKHRITQTKPHDSSGIPVFLTPKISAKFYRGTRMGTSNAAGVGQNRQLSTNNQLYLENGKR